MDSLRLPPHTRCYSCGAEIVFGELYEIIGYYPGEKCSGCLQEPTFRNGRGTPSDVRFAKLRQENLALRERLLHWERAKAHIDHAYACLLESERRDILPREVAALYEALEKAWLSMDESCQELPVTGPTAPAQ